jgi:hypothetical protein
MTSIMALAARPLLAFGMNRSVLPVQSVAAWPSIQGFLFLFGSIALSFQEAVVAKAAADHDSIRPLRRLGILIAVCLGAVYAITAAVGGLRWWFRAVAGLAPSLVAIAVPASILLMLNPVALVVRSYLSGLLVARHITKPLSVAVAINLSILFLGVLILPIVTDGIGTIVAAVSFLTANFIHAGALVVARRRHPTPGKLGFS